MSLIKDASQHHHLFTVNGHLDEHAIILDVIIFLDHFQLSKLCRSKTWIAFSSWSAKEGQIITADVWFNGKADVVALGRIRALVNEGEGDSVAEWPNEEGVVISFAEAGKHRQTGPFP